MPRHHLVVALFIAGALQGCSRESVTQYVKVPAGAVALTHVGLIDGTGDPALSDQTIVMNEGRITAVGPSTGVGHPPGAQVLDLAGHTVIPGLVGMHNHLFYELGAPTESPRSLASQRAFARLYLASGVTTIRTAGTVDLAGDLRIKAAIDKGREPGPRIHVTSPYLGARGTSPDPAAIAEQVNRWAEQGATSIKAYTTVRAEELKAAINAAHTRGLRVTGHLCAVSFRTAAALGIDNLEHGFVFDSGLVRGRDDDECPNQWDIFEAATSMRADAQAVQQIIRSLITNGVALTSTLTAIESFTGRDVVFDRRVPDLLAPRLRPTYAAASAEWAKRDSRAARIWSDVLAREMEFERAFAAAGGKLLAGVDPTGWGGVMAGFGDQRQIELLAEAGFSAEQAIRIATANGAVFLREQTRIGTIEAGKLADLVVLRGDLARNISSIRNVHLVFKDGVGYDPAALIDSAHGSVGEWQWQQFFRWPYNAVAVVLVLILIVRVAARGRRSPEPAAAPETVRN